jgi:hypothetical protein
MRYKEMSSAVREPSQIPNNKLYINVGAIQSTIYQEPSTVLTSVSWVTSFGQLSTAGTTILRDMGKTVYLGTVNGGASQSSIFRKVQLVTNAAGGGTGQVSGDTSYLTGYISLGGQTFGGGDASATRVARLN